MCDLASYVGIGTFLTFGLVEDSFTMVYEQSSMKYSITPVVITYI
jgi:hypothetical protein